MLRTAILKLRVFIAPPCTAYTGWC